MISETLPLNEWPSEQLKKLMTAIALANLTAIDLYPKINESCEIFLSVVKSAIKDAEERESKLPF